jgi:cell division protease FtsH
MAMGGKVAEELIFGAENVTSGATSDIQQVSRIARAMVTQFGFSEALGNVDYANERESYLGATSGGTSHSGTTQKLIDDEVKKIVDEGYSRAKQILTDQIEDLHRLAKGLLEYETLTGEQITRIIAGQPLAAVDDGMGPGPSSSGGGDILAVPKTRARKPKADPAPEPSA